MATTPPSQSEGENPPREPSPDPADIVGRHEKLVLRTALISGLTLASRLIGFARESISASMFGDRSAVNDAFVTAWRVPNLFRSMLGEGAISTSLQAALTKADAEEGLEAGRKLFLALLRTVWWLLFGLCAVTMLAVWVMPDTMPITGARWLGEQPAIVRELVVRMMPFVIFVCLSAVASGALNVRGHFLSPSLAPVLMNCWWICALLIVAREFGWHRPEGTNDAQEFARQMDMARWLATFVLVAGAILLLVQVPALISKGLLLAPPGSRVSRVHAREAHAREVWGILRASAPLALGAAVYQVNIMIDGLMAESMLPSGGPSALYYATRIQQFPMSLVSIAATSAVFPVLTALGHKRELGQVRKLHDDTHLAIAFVAVPATLGLFLFSRPIVELCFHHGAFGESGVERAAAALRWLTIAILPAGAAGLVARTFYALGDFRTPVKIAIAMLVANTVLNYVFVAFVHMDADGLALATAITAWANFVWLLPGLRTRFGLPSAAPDVGRRLVLVLTASAVSTGAGLFTYRILAHEPPAAAPLFAAILVAIGSYAGLAHVLHIPEWRHLLARVGRRRSNGT